MKNKNETLVARKKAVTEFKKVFPHFDGRRICGLGDGAFGAKIELKDGVVAVVSLAELPKNRSLHQESESFFRVDQVI